MKHLLYAAFLASSLATVEAKPPRHRTSLKLKREVRKPHREWGVVLESECEHVINACLQMGREKVWPSYANTSTPDGGVK